MSDIPLNWDCENCHALQAEIERLRAEAECNYCHQYHGKEVCDTLQAELKLANAVVDKAKDRLHKIDSWCRAYPDTVFIEPTKEQWAEANRVLDAAEGCPSLTAISGSNMRHVVNGIKALAALEEDKDNA